MKKILIMLFVSCTINAALFPVTTDQIIKALELYHPMINKTFIEVTNAALKELEQENPNALEQLTCKARSKLIKKIKQNILSKKNGIYTKSDSKRNERLNSLLESIRSKKSTNNQLECVVCLEQKFLPFNLSCAHSYCTACIYDWYMAKDNRSNPTCPTCRQVITEADTQKLKLLPIYSHDIQIEKAGKAKKARLAHIRQRQENAEQERADHELALQLQELNDNNGNENDQEESSEEGY